MDKQSKPIDLDKFVLDTIGKCPPKSSPCLKESAEILMSNISYEEVMAVLEKYIKNPDIFNACHQITHEFGRIEYERTGDISKVFNKAKPSCYEGFFHGATEAYFLDNNIALDPHNEKFKSFIPSICGGLEYKSQKDLLISCVHGIGHSLMYITQNELPLALELCDKLSTKYEREGCYSGIFMENRSDEFSVDHPTKYIDKNNPDYPCTIISEQYKYVCYGYQATRVYSISGFIFKDAVNFCESIPAEYQKRCIRQLSSHVAGYPKSKESLKEDCVGIADNELVSECIISISRKFIQTNLGDPAEALQFCETIKDGGKKTCIDTVADEVNNRKSVN